MEVDSLSRWVASPDLSADDGHCLSWYNPRHRGYAYPELSGLLLSFLCRSGGDPARAEQVHDALSVNASPDGARRGSVTYAFDTAMALRGLLDHREDRVLLDPPVPDWTAALIRAVSAGQGTDPAEELTPDTRWSMAFGAHQAKVGGALVAAARRGVRAAEIGVALAVLRERTLVLSDEQGRFRIHAASPMTYLHSHCYALEGLLMMAEDDPGATAEIGLGVEWLARTQGASGGWRAWHDGREASGPERTDATAQAVRLMRLTDERRYRRAIDAAQAFLVCTQGEHPGLPYEPGSLDLTSWSTLFTAQAFAPPGHPLCPTRARDLV
jgi:hypothetical protein